jgi:beta-lactamase regulating signal transducer with metallopeptidase domain
MNYFALLDANLLSFAVRWSLVLSFAVLLVLALRPWLRRFGAAASYGLWGLVPLAWLVSFVPGPSLESAAASDTLLWQQYLTLPMRQSVAESSAHAVNTLGSC